MSDPEPWERWRELMGHVRDSRSAERALLGIAADVASLLPADANLRREWAPAGLTVEMRPLATSGLCIRGSRRVLVRQRDPLTRRRYTVAHELGHLLLAHAVDSNALRLTTPEEERLCERFASRALIPRERLAKYVDHSPPRPSLSWLTDASDHFRVSLSALVIALTEMEWTGGAAYVLTRKAGHPKRPSQVALRIAHSAGPPWVRLPVLQRLRSLGLTELTRWEQTQDPGALTRGRDVGVALTPGTGAPKRTASYQGAVDFEARVLAGRYRAVMALDLSELECRRRAPTRPRHSSVCATQLALTVG